MNDTSLELADELFNAGIIPDEAAEVAALQKLRDRIDAELDSRDFEDPYPYLDTWEQALRMAIFERLGSAEIDGRIQLQTMSMVEKWVKTGDVPPAEKAKHIKPVAS
jgi:hypothetical protein